jgi:L-ascorbate metabolism protein UlaG (beta-lactamase superfamily)
MAEGVVDGVGDGDGPGDPQPVAKTPTTTTAARVRADAATRDAIRDASSRSGAGSGPEVRSESVGRGMAGIVAWALEVAVSSSSAVLGIHTGCVVFGSRNCGTKPSEPSGPSSLSPTGGADWAGASGPPFPGGLDGAGTARPSAQHAPTQRAAPHPRRAQRPVSATWQNPPMELQWFGRTCVRLKGRDAVVVADAYQAIVGPTGRGISGDIVTFSHPDDDPLPRAKGVATRDGGIYLPTSLEGAFVLEGPGEYEFKHVLVTGVRTFRDDKRGADRGRNVTFAVELDGIRIAHLGDIAHILTEEKIGEIGPVDVACVPIGGQLSATRAAEVIAQLDPKIVVPMPVCEDERDCDEALAKFLHEMGAKDATPQPKLTITPSSIPDETTTVLLESRGKV